MPLKKVYLAISMVLVLFLCVAQIIGSTLLILPCLAVFMALVGWSCSGDFTLPILLFFLPWSPVLRTSPTGHSFFTFGLVLICAISVIKKRFHFKRYPIVTGIALLFFTLLSKLLDGHSLAFDYIAFMMLIIFFPVVKGEWTVKKYDFYTAMVFFSVGIILAALCALSFATFPNIAKFIRVDAYLTITRRCGFYGDPNFYTAQITAALAGCLMLILKERKRSHTVWIIILLVLLLYCGFLSASKSFVIVSACMLVLWLIGLLKMQGRTALKVTMLISIAVVAVFIATSAAFGELIQIVITRFSYSKDIASFTTGRTGLWKMYLEEIFSNVKVFFLGRGYTNIKINDRSSHNTLLQGFYQFGFLGVPFLVYWITSFFRGAAYKGYRRNTRVLETLILLIGVFMPWLAIDALFFDEFFLLQWYVFSALRYLDAYAMEDAYGRAIENE